MKYFLILIVLSLGVPQAARAQDMFKQKKERKKIWKRWKSNRQSYNPYLEKKAKNKPSAKMRREESREIRRQNRAAKKQMNSSRRKTGYKRLKRSERRR